MRKWSLSFSNTGKELSNNISLGISIIFLMAFTAFILNGLGYFESELKIGDTYIDVMNKDDPFTVNDTTYIRILDIRDDYLQCNCWAPGGYNRTNSFHKSYFYNNLTKLAE